MQNSLLSVQGQFGKLSNSLGEQSVKVVVFKHLRLTEYNCLAYY
jgi:hypothetical protein